MESGKTPMDYSSDPEAEWVALAQPSLGLAWGEHALGSELSSYLFLLLPIFFPFVLCESCCCLSQLHTGFLPEFTRLDRGFLSKLLDK